MMKQMDMNEMEDVFDDMADMMADMEEINEVMQELCLVGVDNGVMRSLNTGGRKT